MAYFPFFQVPVKASEAEFYKDHVVPLKILIQVKIDLIGVKRFVNTQTLIRLYSTIR